MIQAAETAERRHQRQTLIETEYIGDGRGLIGTTGEAYYDVTSGKWMYRPTNPINTKNFVKVDPDELECSSDEGWVKGEYLGLKNIPKNGKATWDEGEERWKYKPKGMQRTFMIPENDFKLIRDQDVF